MLADLARRAYCDHYLPLWHDNGAWYLQKCFTPEQLEKELGDPNSRFFRVNYQNEPVGYLKLNLAQPESSYIHTDFVPPANSLELERIYFLKKATGKGIGSAAMQFVDDFARQQGKTAVWLKAMDSSHAAIAFYEKQGYRLCGTHRLDFPAMKEEFWGMIILEKKL